MLVHYGSTIVSILRYHMLMHYGSTIVSILRYHMLMHYGSIIVSILRYHMLVHYGSTLVSNLRYHILVHYGSTIVSILRRHMTAVTVQCHVCEHVTGCRVCIQSVELRLLTWSVLYKQHSHETHVRCTHWRGRGEGGGGRGDCLEGHERVLLDEYRYVYWVWPLIGTSFKPFFRE